MHVAQTSSTKDAVWGLRLWVGRLEENAVNAKVVGAAGRLCNLN
jgi:hypothetical protein